MFDTFSISFRFLVDYTSCKSEVDVTMPASIYDLRTPESTCRAAFNGIEMGLQMRTQLVTVLQLEGTDALPKPHWLRTNKLPVFKIEYGKFAGCNIIPRKAKEKKA